MGYELRDHTADISVAATGDDLESVFGSVADGLAAASCEEIPANGERFSVSVTAERLEALLFDYMDELIYLRDVRLELPVDNRVERIELPDSSIPSKSGDATYSLEATARGVPLSTIDAREIKAVTYSEMRLEETESGWEAYVVFDV